MAASNLKARVERLEQQHGGVESLIVVIRHFGEFEQGRGVVVDGMFYPCPMGVDVDELERKVIADVNSGGARRLIVVERAEPMEIA
ncbi:hypothetical protein [Burkholderia gladioli]|uniref:hypothetical protein n=1 Tax=Burkholderia gladioli TaxID=28095 RepID=UPI001641D42C|nr:hypothetical protein [Burkholderia gladioli]